MDTAKNYPTCAKPQTLDADDKQAPQSSRLSHHPSSRMFRVSRASGGKDRHSKVYTSKGLRDRRIRLSINTAIQFYDLQERLGFDQPSKAIEWLIKAAESAIAELPSLECTFPMIGSDVREAEPSSNSETSKGSVLSLSRYENGGKGKENGGNMKSEGSFTRLLTSGSGSGSGSGFGLNVASAGSGDYLRSGYSSASEMQQFAFLQEQYCPDAGGIYNLNFSISPGVSGFHRGTLQSNSPSNHNHHHHHHQEPFLFSAAASATAASPSERPYSAGFNGHLQLCDGYEEIELKGKGKS